MKQITILLIAFFSSFTVSGLMAQGTVRQQGYVRTVGRPNNPKGSPLQGVLVRVRGQHNEVRSGRDGRFELLFAGKRVGVDAFVFNAVRLAGYDLQEKEMIGRSYALSATVPVELVMVPQALKREIEDKVRRTIEAQYQRKLRGIEALRQKDAARYERELQQLEVEYEKRDQLINDMVERYASTDYAHLDSLSARINQYIEAGELERADSLINAQDLAHMEAEHAALETHAEKLRTDLRQTEQAVQSSTAQLLSLYEGKLQIHLARFERDSVAAYFDKMVRLDTTNVSVLLRASYFCSLYMADYDRALAYCRSALQQCLLQPDGEKGRSTAVAYNNMASTFGHMGRYDEALECQKKALDMRVAVLGENHPDVALYDENLAVLYSRMSRFTEALECHEKALGIYSSAYGEKSRNVAWCYGNMGTVLDLMADYDRALECYDRALAIYQDLGGNGSMDVANLYNNIAACHNAMGHYGRALEYFGKALVIERKLLGETHPNVATIFNNLGGVYLNLKDTEKALEHFMKACELRVSKYGEMHPDVALSYGNLANCYWNMGQRERAIEYSRKSLGIDLRVLGENHRRVAHDYHDIGTMYYNSGDCAHALPYYGKALDIYQKVFGRKHPDVGLEYYCRAMAYDDMADHAKALEDYSNAVDVWHSVQNNPYTVQQLLAEMEVYKHYNLLYRMNPQEWKDKYRDYLDCHMVSATTFQGGEAESRGMDGTYYVMAFGEWTEDSLSCVLDMNLKYKGKPKTVVFYRDGMLRSERFEDSVGIIFGIKAVDKAERERVMKEWKKWKR